MAVDVVSESGNASCFDVEGVPDFLELGAFFRLEMIVDAPSASEDEGSWGESMRKGMAMVRGQGLRCGAGRVGETARKGCPL